MAPWTLSPPHLVLRVPNIQWQGLVRLLAEEICKSKYYLLS
jgi:hypothetical protein